MAANPYLDSVVKILPAVQARNIVDLLSDLRERGQIRNADEYEAKLRELSVLINDTDPKPSFQQIRGLIWHLVSSDAHSEMMKAAQADLRAIFEQASEMGSRLDDHYFLVMKNLAADLDRGLNDQQANIDRLEWLASQNNEFSLALVNTFDSASIMKLPRSEAGAFNLYFDNRTYQNRTEAELPSAVVSEYNGTLLLGSSNEPKILPLSVRLNSDSSSYGTELELDTNNNILNCIDGVTGTYWTRNIYLGSRVPKVTTVMEFDLGIAKDLNHLIVEGAAPTAFYIDRVEAIAPDGHKISLKSTASQVNGKLRINFSRVLARSIRITFSVKSYFRVSYNSDPMSESWSLFDDKTKLTQHDLAQKLGPLIGESINSKKLSTLLNIPSGISETIEGYLYSFGLDNVWFGNSLYEDSGIFVSRPLKGQNFGICAVQATEEVSTSESVSNSIEYEMTKKDLSPIYKESRFSIPYLSQTEVVSERLILTKRITDSVQSDAGALRFCPYVDPNWDWASDPTPPVRIYKNGDELVINEDFSISISLDASQEKLYWVTAWDDTYTDSRDFSKYTLLPQEMWIKINLPDPTAVYTADYTIRTSDTYVDDKTVWLDKDKLIFLSEGGRVYFRRDNPDMTLDSELYLQITLRRNTASQSSSPELSKYTILGATYKS